MLNPYEATTYEFTESKTIRLRSAITMGLVGYFGPVALMLMLCMLHYGWDVMVDNVRKFILIHWPITVTGMLALAPHFLCAGLLAWGSLRPERTGRSHLFDPRKLGMAALIGFIVLIVISAVWNPIPWTWSAGLTASIRLAFVILFPVNMIAYGLLRKGFIPNKAEGRDES